MRSVVVLQVVPRVVGLWELHTLARMGFVRLRFVQIGGVAVVGVAGRVGAFQDHGVGWLVAVAVGAVFSGTWAYAAWW